MPPAPRSKSQTTRLDRAALTGDSARVARVVAAALLENVKKTSEELQDDANPDALHDFRVAVRRLRSWTRAFDREMRDTLKGKHRRRLERLADATRASRDYEVHIEWVEHFARARRRRRRAGTEWLVDRLQAKKARADLDFRRALDADLARAVAGFTKALNRYTVRIDEPWPPFAQSLAELIRTHASAARKALASVSNIGDRMEGHEARIAAKRLRYLLEPLRDVDPLAERSVDRLSRLQDDFGALHDAQVFGSDIARLLAKVLASTAISAQKATPTRRPKPRTIARICYSRSRGGCIKTRWRRSHASRTPGSRTEQAISGTMSTRLLAGSSKTRTRSARCTQVSDASHPNRRVRSRLTSCTPRAP